MPLECKPVIYLYPEAETEVTVRLEYKGRLTCTYPAPDPDGTWHVTARPNGTLTDRQGREYNYLFWERASDETPPEITHVFTKSGTLALKFADGTNVDMNPNLAKPITATLRN